MSNSVGGLGVGLSLVCGCLVLALVGQLYYLQWWKKKVANREEEVVEDEHKSSTNYAKGLFGFMCWKSNNNSAIEPSLGIQVQPDLELGGSNNDNIKESVELELMRLHNLAGPPRFLFTIKEETKEDLESEDGKSRKGSRTGSLSDIILASPRGMRSPNSLLNLDSYHQLGFNPLFEASSAETELNRLRSSSPPPKFKFLRDAEEKLIRRLVEEAEKKGSKEIEVKTVDSGVGKEEELCKGSFMGFIVDMKNKEDHHHLPVQYPSSSSQRREDVATGYTDSEGDEQMSWTTGKDEYDIIVADLGKDVEDYKIWQEDDPSGL